MNIPFMTRSAFGGITVTLLQLWDGFGIAVQLLMVLMVIDIVAGVMLAASSSNVNVAVMWKGVTKKAMALLVVGMASAFDSSISVPLRDVVAGFYAGVEGLSILAHATEAGVPIPSVLTNIFKQQGVTDGK